MKLPITNRLITVSEMVKKTDIMCDIGCDHGYLPINLILEKKVNFAYGCDINDCPLNAARKNFERFSLSDKAEFRKGDGLTAVPDIAFGLVTICGMGGRLIAKILSDGREMLNENTQIILQPMTDVWILRDFLYKNNFHIKSEKLAKEDDRFYNIIEAAMGFKKEISFSDIYTGVSFIDKNNCHFDEYIKKQHRKFTKMYYFKKGHEDVVWLENIIFDLEKMMK